MTNYDVLTEENFDLFAAKHYDNPTCFSREEFEEDINRFKYIKKLVYRYIDRGELRERLILNHIIVLYNVFGEAATRMMAYRLGDLLPYLIPFLQIINRLPETITINPGKVINTSTIITDANITTVLRNL